VTTGKPTTNTRSGRGKVSPALSQPNNSPKRKSQQEIKLGAGMTNDLGFVKVKKRKTSAANTYGKKASRPAAKINSGQLAFLLFAQDEH
jgi:hypothetical protein